MRAVRRVLGHWLVTSFLAILILSLVLWFLGELLELGTWRPFDSPVTRGVIIAIMATIWLVLLGIWYWRRRRRNAKMVEEIVEEAPDPTAEAMSAEQSTVQSKFNAAMRDLAKLRFKSRFGGSRYLYELPWYIFIGPPGAGKTTALEKCGLEFPRRRSGEKLEITDTRNIEWIFTNEAVFIDTAGRYLTQDSNKAVDASAWQKLLDLIVRRRPAEPINGVIVAISISELATADTRTIDGHAEDVRDRLIEICEKMRARVPVYLMFTKVDLLVGFNEFFQRLSKAEREQVWGTTFPLKGGIPARERIARDLEETGENFDLLIDRLGELQFPLMQVENDIETRTKIFGFASQFSSLKPVIERFMQQAFRPDKWSEAILLRGFYFSSATQVGQPVDRLISNMWHEFGIQRRVVDTLTGDTSRSYFLGGLLRNVIFPESGLISAARKARRTMIGMRYATVAACVAVPILFGLAWWQVEEHMEAQAKSLSNVLTEYELGTKLLGRAAIGDEQSAGMALVEDDNLESVMKPLNLVRDELARLESDDQDAPYFGLGIGAMHDLRQQARLAYNQALEDLFRPRLLYRLENQLADNQHLPEVLYDYLKAYLMVGGRGPLDPEFVQAFMAEDWEDRYERELNTDLFEDLNSHLDALLELEPRQDMKLNDEAIGISRVAIAKVSLAVRAFSILKSHKDVKSLRPWRPSDAAGPAVGTVFVRGSGLDINEPIPGIFTYEGFWQRFVPNADLIVDAALEEKWLFEEGADTEPTREEIVRTRAEIRRLYYEEYIKVWSGFLKDLRVVPFQSAKHAADTLGLLSSTSSPLKSLLESVVYNTHLAERPGAESAIMKEAGAIAFHRFSSRFRNAARLAEAAQDQQENAPAKTEGAPVQQAFGPLRDYVGSDGSSGELARTLVGLDSLYNAVTDMATKRNTDLSVLSSQPAAVNLSRQLRNAPTEVRGLLDEMLEQADEATVGGIKAQLNEVWRSTIAPACREQLHGRYPFGKGREVALGDLAAVLGHDGLIDSFYKKRLAALVDDAVLPWRWKGNVGASLGIPNSDLDFFYRASQLRDAFFPAGRPSPELAFDVSVLAWDPEVTHARFVLGGTEAAFSPDEADGARQYQLKWPGDQAASGVEVAVSRRSDSINFQGSQVPGPEVRIADSGPWGLFKLIRKSGFKTFGAGDTARVDINVQGGRLFLQLKMRSATNPLKLLKTIRDFRCPGSLGR